MHAVDEDLEARLTGVDGDKDANKGASVTGLNDGVPQKLCFVIGPIGQPETPEKKHSDFLLWGIVKYVLGREPFNYIVRRADEDSDPGMIGNRIITDLLRADLVVADLTDLNPNVFYELGIRHSKLKPTIHMARTGTTLPFDNTSHRCIFFDVSDWENIELVRRTLASFTTATEASGFQVSNPITQANANYTMRESSDPSDRLLADLTDKVAGLDAKIEKVGSLIPTRTASGTLRIDPAPVIDKINLSSFTVPILRTTLTDGSLLPRDPVSET